MLHLLLQAFDGSYLFFEVIPGFLLLLLMLCHKLLVPCLLFDLNLLLVLGLFFLLALIHQIQVSHQNLVVL